MGLFRALFAAAVALAVVVVTATVVGLQVQSGGAANQSASSDVSLVPAPSARTGLGNRRGFVHPGVLVTKSQLDLVRRKIKTRQEPWRSAYDLMKGSRFARLTWQASPRPTVECGPSSRPDFGCTQESEDAVAAYTHALLWYFTRNRRHAEKAIEILDAWSAVLRQHTNSNAPLQAAWSAATFVRAAELIRHTYSGWRPERQSRTVRMFRTVYLPVVIGGAATKAGNWELIMMDAAIGIAVFLNDRATFNKAVARWRTRIRAYIYLSSDGPLPKGPPSGARTRPELIAYWHGQSIFVDGLSQETCRDFLHTGWGLSAAAHVAETAWIQGIDLYAEARQRITQALEFHARYGWGEPVPSWLCGGTVNGGLAPLPEVAYNHYANRVGIELPRSKRLIEAYRPQWAAFFFAWETLTHGGSLADVHRKPF